MKANQNSSTNNNCLSRISCVADFTISHYRKNKVIPIELFREALVIPIRARLVPAELSFVNVSFSESKRQFRFLVGHQFLI
jgi:hypothetical protein